MRITKRFNINLGVTALLMFAMAASTARAQDGEAPKAVVANPTVSATSKVSTPQIVAASELIESQQSQLPTTDSVPAVSTLSPVADPKSMLNSAAKTPASTSTAAQLLQVFMGLGAVLLLIFALSWVLKRVGNSTGFTASQIKVVSSLNMGNREKIVLTEVNGQQLLLGVTATSINMLHHFDAENKAAPQETETAGESKAESVVDFKSKLANVMAANKKPV